MSKLYLNGNYLVFFIIAAAITFIVGLSFSFAEMEKNYNKETIEKKVILDTIQKIYVVNGKKTAILIEVYTEGSDTIKIEEKTQGKE